MTTDTHYQNLIRRELEHRSEKNSRYSLRAFAKSLGFEATVISQILSGKRVPSFKTAQRIIENMNLDPATAHDFLASIAETQKNRGLQRMSPFFNQTFSSEELANSSAQDLSIDHFRVIADWYHIAILELTFVEGFESNPNWIAKELGITPLEAKLAVERLLKLGLLSKRKGRLVKSKGTLTTTDKHLTTPALKRHQKQILEKALESLEKDPIEIRNMSGFMMPADPKLIPQAKKLIEECNQKISRLLQSGRKTQVYQLHVSLYPVQKTKKDT